MTNTSHGLFITFEGIDGSGKSTQLQRSAKALREKGITVTETRNPGGTAIGKQLREILLHHTGFVSPMAEMMLYMADRAQHMEEVVLPALARGEVVLCDRHLDSTVAYQGYGRGLDLSQIHRLNEMATLGRLPDRTFLFDGPPETLALRVNKRGAADRLEREALTFHHQVRKGFLALAEGNPERFVVLDALQPLDTLQAQVMASLQTLR